MTSIDQIRPRLTVDESVGLTPRPSYFSRVALGAGAAVGLLLLLYAGSKPPTNVSQASVAKVAEVSLAQRSVTVVFGKRADEEVIAYEWNSDPLTIERAPPELIADLKANAWLTPARYPIVAFRQDIPICNSPFPIDEVHEAVAANDLVWAAKIPGCFMLKAHTAVEWTRFDQQVGAHRAAQIRFLAADGRRLTLYTLNPYDRVAKGGFPAP